MNPPPNVDPRKTLRFVIALHEIGKRIAESAQESTRVLSAEILGQCMNQAGFSRAEVELGQALVKNDIMDSMFQAWITPQEAFEKLVELSSRTNISAKDFFFLQGMLFISIEASRHPGAPPASIDDKYQILRNLFENAPAVH